MRVAFRVERATTARWHALTAAVPWTARVHDLEEAVAAALRTTSRRGSNPPRLQLMGTGPSAPPESAAATARALDDPLETLRAAAGNEAVNLYLLVDDGARDDDQNNGDRQAAPTALHSPTPLHVRWTATEAAQAELRAADEAGMRLVAVLAMPLLRVAHASVYGAVPREHEATQLREAYAERAASSGTRSGNGSLAAVSSSTSSTSSVLAKPESKKASFSEAATSAQRQQQPLAAEADDPAAPPWLPLLHASLWTNLSTVFVVPCVEHLAVHHMHMEGQEEANPSGAYFLPKNKALSEDTAHLWERLGVGKDRETLPSDRQTRDEWLGSLNQRLRSNTVVVTSPELSDLEPSVWLNALQFFPADRMPRSRTDAASIRNARFFTAAFDTVPPEAARVIPASQSDEDGRTALVVRSVSEGAELLKEHKHMLRHSYEQRSNPVEQVDVARLLALAASFAHIVRQQWIAWGKDLQLNQQPSGRGRPVVADATVCAAQAQEATTVINKLMALLEQVLVGDDIAGEPSVAFGTVPAASLAFPAELDVVLADAFGLRETPTAAMPPLRVLISPPHCSPAGALVLADWAAVIDFAEDAAFIVPPAAASAAAAAATAAAAASTTTTTAASSFATAEMRDAGSNVSDNYVPLFSTVDQTNLRMTKSLSTAMALSARNYPCTLETAKPDIVARGDTVAGNEWKMACDDVRAATARRIFAPFSTSQAGASAAKTVRARDYFKPETGEMIMEHRPPIQALTIGLQGVASSVLERRKQTSQRIVITLLAYFPYAVPVGKTGPNGRPGFSTSAGLTRDGGPVQRDFAFAFFLNSFLTAVYRDGLTDIIILTDNHRVGRDNFAWLLSNELWLSRARLVYLPPARLEVCLLLGDMDASRSNGIYLPTTRSRKELLAPPNPQGAVSTPKNLILRSKALYADFLAAGLELLHCDTPRALPRPFRVQDDSGEGQPNGSNLAVAWLREAALDFALGEPAAWALFDADFMMECGFRPRVVVQRTREITDRICSTVREACRRSYSCIGTCIRVLLQHEPRVGASTVVRSVLWNSLVIGDGLRGIVVGEVWASCPQAQQNRALSDLVDALATQSRQPLLVLMDREISDATVRSFESLVRSVRPRIPVVILRLAHVRGPHPNAPDSGSSMLAEPASAVSDIVEGVRGRDAVGSNSFGQLVIDIGPPTSSEKAAVLDAYDDLRRLLDPNYRGRQRAADGVRDDLHLASLETRSFLRVLSFLQFASIPTDSGRQVEQRMESFVERAVWQLHASANSGTSTAARRGALRLLAYLALLQCAAPGRAAVQLLPLAACLDDEREHMPLHASCADARRALHSHASASLGATLAKADATEIAAVKSEIVQIWLFGRPDKAAAAVRESAVFPAASPATGHVGAADRLASVIYSEGAAAMEALGSSFARDHVAGGVLERADQYAPRELETLLRELTWIKADDARSGSDVGADLDGSVWTEVIHCIRRDGGVAVQFQRVLAPIFLKKFLQHTMETAVGAGASAGSGHLNSVFALTLSFLAFVRRHFAGQVDLDIPARRSAADGHLQRTGRGPVHPASALFVALTTRDNESALRLQVEPQAAGATLDRHSFGPLVAAMVPGGTSGIKWAPSASTAPTGETGYTRTTASGTASSDSGGTITATADSNRSTDRRISRAPSAQPTDLSDAHELLYLAYCVYNRRRELRLVLARFQIALIDQAQATMLRFVMDLRVTGHVERQSDGGGRWHRDGVHSSIRNAPRFEVLGSASYQGHMAAMAVDAAHAYNVAVNLLSASPSHSADWDSLADLDILGNAGHFYASLTLLTAQAHVRGKNCVFSGATRTGLLRVELSAFERIVRDAQAAFDKERDLGVRINRPVEAREYAASNESRLWNSVFKKVEHLWKDICDSVAETPGERPWWTLPFLDANKTLASCIDRLEALSDELTSILMAPTSRTTDRTNMLATRRDTAFNDLLRILVVTAGQQGASVYKADDVNEQLMRLRGDVEAAESALVKAEAAADATAESLEHPRTQLYLARRRLVSVSKCFWSGLTRPTSKTLCETLAKLRWKPEQHLEFVFHRAAKPLAETSFAPTAIRELAYLFMCQLSPFTQQRFLSPPEPGPASLPGWNPVNAAGSSRKTGAQGARTPRLPLMCTEQLVDLVSKWAGTTTDSASYARLWRAMLQLQIALEGTGNGGEANLFLNANGRLDLSRSQRNSTDLGWIGGTLQEVKSVPLASYYFEFGLRQPRSQPKLEVGGCVEGSSICWRGQFSRLDEAMTMQSSQSEFRDIVVRGQVLRLIDTSSGWVHGVMTITHVERAAVSLGNRVHGDAQPGTTSRGEDRSGDIEQGLWHPVSEALGIHVRFVLARLAFQRLAATGDGLQPVTGGWVKGHLYSGPRAFQSGFEILARHVQADLDFQPELAVLAREGPGSVDSEILTLDPEVPPLAVHSSDDRDLLDPRESPYNMSAATVRPTNASGAASAANSGRPTSNSLGVTTTSTDELEPKPAASVSQPRSAHDGMRSKHATSVVVGDGRISAGARQQADGMQVLGSSMAISLAAIPQLRAFSSGPTAGTPIMLHSVPKMRQVLNGVVDTRKSARSGDRCVWYLASGKQSTSVDGAQPHASVPWPIYAAVSLFAIEHDPNVHSLVRDAIIVDADGASADDALATVDVLKRLFVFVALPYWSLVTAGDCIYLLRLDSRDAAFRGSANPRRILPDQRKGDLKLFYYRKDASVSSVAGAVACLWRFATEKLESSCRDIKAAGPLGKAQAIPGDWNPRLDQVRPLLLTPSALPLNRSGVVSPQTPWQGWNAGGQTLGIPIPAGPPVATVAPIAAKTVRSASERSNESVGPTVSATESVATAAKPSVVPARSSAVEGASGRSASARPAAGPAAPAGAYLAPASTAPATAAGQGGTVAAGQGSRVAAGQGGKVATGQGSTVAAGQGGTVAAGQGSKVAAGQGGKVATGQGNTVAAGQGSKVAAGQGGTVAAGQGGTVAAGRGSTVAAGQGGKVEAGQGGTVAAPNPTAVQPTTPPAAAASAAVSVGAGDPAGVAPPASDDGEWQEVFQGKRGKRRT